MKELVSKYEKQSKNSCMVSPSRLALINWMQKMGEQVGNLLQEGDQLNGKLFWSQTRDSCEEQRGTGDKKKFDSLKATRADIGFAQKQRSQ